MMTMPANETKMKYALYLYTLDVVSTNYMGEPQFYEDAEGERTYFVTGEKKSIFSDPTDFEVNISFSGGEAQEQSYGLSIADYDGVIIYQRGSYPITEGTLIWTKSPVEYEDSVYLTADLHELISVNVVKQVSADFICKKVSESKNITRLDISAINK